MDHHLARRARIAALALAITSLPLAAAGVAAASRPSVRPELSAMVYHAGARYYGGLPVDQPRTAPLKCFAGDISTMVKGSQWGAYRWSAYGVAPANQRKCRAAQRDHDPAQDQGTLVRALGRQRRLPTHAPRKRRQLHPAARAAQRRQRPHPGPLLTRLAPATVLALVERNN